MTVKARPVFKRWAAPGVLQEYVAVRRIKRGPDIVEPGEVLTAKLHVLKRWYRLRRIGPKGHPWTEQALAQPHNKVPRPFYTAETEAEVEAEVEGEVKAKAPKKKRGRPAKAVLPAGVTASEG